VLPPLAAKKPMQLVTVEQNPIAKLTNNLLFKVGFMKSLLLKRHFLF
jgi:hypothetical protein